MYYVECTFESDQLISSKCCDWCTNSDVQW